MGDADQDLASLLNGTPGWSQVRPSPAPPPNNHPPPFTAPAGVAAPDARPAPDNPGQPVATLTTPTQATNASARSLRKQGRSVEATNEYSNSLQNSTSSETYVGLAQSLIDQRRYSEAEARLHDALAVNPQDPEALAQLAFLLEDLGRSQEARDAYVKAEAAYRQLTATGSTDPDAYRNLGRVLDGLGRSSEGEAAFGRAQALYQLALESNPNDTDLLAGLGYVLDELGRRDEALKAYEKVIQLDPDDRFAKFDKAVVLDNMGRYKEAEAAYREANPPNDDDPDCYSALGWVLSKLGRYGEAEGACRRALELRANHSEALAGLGFALEHLGRTPEAEAAYRQSLGWAPNAPEALCNLAHLLNANDRPEEAELLCRRGLERDKTWQAFGTLASIHVKLADKYHDSDLYGDAIDEIKQAFKLFQGPTEDRGRDDAAGLHLQLGNAEISLGNYPSGRAALRKALRTASSPNSSVAILAQRNLRRLRDRLRSNVQVPVWVGYAVSLLAILGILYGLLVQRQKLDSAGFVGFVMGMLFVIFAAFSLPAITHLKIGPAELEKPSGITTPPQIEKSL